MQMKKVAAMILIGSLGVLTMATAVFGFLRWKSHNRIQRMEQARQEAVAGYQREIQIAFTNFAEHVQTRADRDFTAIGENANKLAKDIVEVWGGSFIKAAVKDMFSRAGNDHRYRDAVTERLTPTLLGPLETLRVHLYQDELAALKEDLQACERRFRSRMAAIPAPCPLAEIPPLEGEVCPGKALDDHFADASGERIAEEMKSLCRQRVVRTSVKCAKVVAVVAVMALNAYVAQKIGKSDQAVKTWLASRATMRTVESLEKKVVLPRFSGKAKSVPLMAAGCGVAGMAFAAEVCQDVETKGSIAVATLEDEIAASLTRLVVERRSGTVSSVMDFGERMLRRYQNAMML